MKQTPAAPRIKILKCNICSVIVFHLLNRADYFIELLDDFISIKCDIIVSFEKKLFYFVVRINKAFNRLLSLKVISFHIKSTYNTTIRKSEFIAFC